MALDHSGIEATAAEYVLGTLRGSDRDIFEARLLEDIALKQMVARWETILTPLAAVIPPEIPPSGAWPRISDTLGFPVQESVNWGRDDATPAIDSSSHGRSTSPKQEAEISTATGRVGAANSEGADNPAGRRSIAERFKIRGLRFPSLKRHRSERRGRNEEAAAQSGPRSDGREVNSGPDSIAGRGSAAEHFPNPGWESAVEALQRKAGRWRMAALAAGGLACLLAVFIVYTGSPAPQAPSPMFLTGVLSPVDASPIWAIRYSEEHGRLQADPVQPGPRLGDQTYELWALMPDSNPVSLGFLPPGRQTTLTLSDSVSQRFGGGIPLAVTIEPGGGSPTGQPTGPIVHTGRLEPLSPTL